MTYAEFRKEHPATRCFDRYDAEARATHASSGRLGYRQRQAVGRFYYVHDMAPGIAFPTAKAATKRAYNAWCAAK